MGRPPCCDKASIKKGPWTPEEDIILVSYIQEHGPGNWRLIPTSSGLMRCSKSCRLRWTNYLRPGIKRGNFNAHEEGNIIQLQGLLGNRWAAIASFLPQRTDNDVKNYWNTHVKKKIKKYQAVMSSYISSSDSARSTSHDVVLGGYLTDEIRNSGTFNSHALTHGSSTYASSAENMSRLLEGWMRSSPHDTLSDEKLQRQMKKESININNYNSFVMNQLNIDVETNSQVLLEDSVIAWDKIVTDSVFEENKQFKMMASDHNKLRMQSQLPPLSMLEKWLLEENTGQMDDLEISSDGYSGAD